MRPLFLAALLCAAAAQPAPAQTTPAQTTPAGEEPVEAYRPSNAHAGATPVRDPQLYAAFGGADGVGRIVDKLVERNTSDPRISDIFKASDLVRLRRTLKEQFCYILAGPCDYTGRDMKAAHADHGLQTADMTAMVENLQRVMDEEGVPFRLQNKLLAKLAPMKRDVVTR